ncbi:hypothetical protein SEA_CLEARASMUD_66 [Microbacterium phage ClearAsMud]|uniref:Uncharacterized protein n=1 Tax=Microbacterium phage ClearAsMud TaxID=2743404 RepID=A0A7G9A0Y7_9CAUD|nr:hypothetical protein QDA07_gp66 [Microbacterium phage ClearAsMud]QNL30276.1 hypothetical protein SEA_CLEARASMUD_66 [Microbacterium phage ClearAsMud]
MRVNVKVNQGGGMFGGGGSAEVDIQTARPAESAEATLAALMLLAQNGIGEYPGDDEETDDDSPEEGYADGSTEDDVPAAGWREDDASANWQAGDQNPVTDLHGSKPGDAVRIVWEGDNSSRLFIDSGTQWVSPAVAGRFSEPMTVEYNASDIRVELIARQAEFGSQPEAV